MSILDAKFRLDEEFNHQAQGRMPRAATREPPIPSKRRLAQDSYQMAGQVWQGTNV